MDQNAFQSFMTDFVREFELGNFDAALELGTDLRTRLIEKDTPPDPFQLGWVRYYIFRCHYGLQNWREGLDLLESTEETPFIISQMNSAWMFSVGAEMAFHLGDVEGVLKHIHMALELRRSDGDKVGEAYAKETARALLGQMDRPDLAAQFTRDPGQPTLT